MEPILDTARSRTHSPLRRTRQACINCRRKKSKCPGEKPQCSTCSRLEQNCIYENFESASRKRARFDSDTSEREQDEVSRRFGSLEEKLNQLAASVQNAVPSLHTATRDENVNSRNAHGHNRAGKNAMPPPMLQSLSTPMGIQAKFGLPFDVIEDGVKTYFSCFHAQPYSLLCQHLFRITEHISPVVLRPMLALAIRCSSHTFWGDPKVAHKWINDLAEESWQGLIQIYASGKTDLTYLQGLCLQTQLDFADGRVYRAHTQIALGITIAQFSGYLSKTVPTTTTRGEDVVRCTYTLFMLNRTYSITRLVSPTLTHHYFQLRKPRSGRELLLKAPSQAPNMNLVDLVDDVDALPIEQDLAALLVTVFSIWDDAIRYVFQTATESTIPPWQPGSELATIEYRFVDFEPDFSTHRYRLVGFPRRAILEPHLRAYYATWLCFQLTYMSIQCCIHHPFIMYIKLQNLIRNVPPSFLQKSYKSSLIHSRWIIRFLDEMDEAGMMLYDPFIGYLCAIAATCQLEHTLSKHPDIAAAARLSFRSALKFLRKLSKYWNNIRVLLGIVEELAARLSHRHTLYYSQDDYDGILPAVETERVGLAEDDTTLMWRLFDFASTSADQGLSPTTKISTNEAVVSELQVPYTPERGRLRSFSGPAGVANSSIPENTNDIQNVGVVPDTNADALNLSLFDQLPEDWVFTIDDWTLFGAPGSTYFYNEGT